MNYGGFKGPGADSWKTRKEKKKHMCPICRIEIANHPSSISIHEKSQQHIEMRNDLLENGGRRSKKYTLPAFQKQENNDDEIAKIELAGTQAFLNNDNKFGTSMIGDRLKSFVSSKNRVDNLGYSKPSDDDNNFSVDQIKNDPVWSSHIDQTSGKVYYYNRITNKSEWKKPKNFDGVDLKERLDNEYTRTFRTFKATPIEEPKKAQEVKIGEWEEVAPEDDFFKKNAYK